MYGSDVDDSEPIVIDNGSWMCKAGFSGGKTARVYERTLIRDYKDKMVGEFVGTKHEEQINVTYMGNIMNRGAVTYWDEMENFLEYVFEKELGITTTDRNVLLTEVPFNNPQNRQKLVEMFMEKFGIQGLYITDPASLALFSSGRTSGIVLDVGGEVTHISALINGTQIQAENPSRRIDFGGNDVTAHLIKELKKHHIKSERLFHEVEDYKHHLCSHDLTNKCETYTLPSGTSFKVEASHMNIIDILFDPSLAGRSTPGAGDMLRQVIMSCEAEERTLLTSNIIISGGASLYYTDITDKMKAHLTGIDSSIKIVAPPERRKSSWLGGSIIASFEEFTTNMCKSRKRYFENGWVDFLTFNDSELVKRS